MLSQAYQINNSDTFYLSDNFDNFDRIDRIDRVDRIDEFKRSEKL